LLPAPLGDDLDSAVRHVDRRLVVDRSRTPTSQGNDLAHAAAQFESALISGTNLATAMSSLIADAEYRAIQADIQTLASPCGQSYTIPGE